MFVLEGEAVRYVGGMGASVGVLGAEVVCLLCDREQTCTFGRW